jgi:hypothetical protein
MAEAAKFNSTTKQAVIVSVWPSSRRRAGEFNGMKIRVPVHLSFGELSCYVGEKLSLLCLTNVQNTSMVDVGGVKQ